MPDTIVNAEAVVEEKPAVVAEGQEVPGAEKPAPVKEEVAAGKTAEGKDGKTDKPEGAPEKYEDWKLPEGVVLEGENKGEVEAIFKELDLSQEKAQKLVDYEVKLRQQAADAAWDTFEKLVSDWGDAAKKDAEFGGNESKFKESMVHAVRARDEFGTAEFKQMLDSTGTGNHPEMIRFLYKVGKALGDAPMLKGGAKPAASDPASVMYPTMQGK